MKDIIKSLQNMFNCSSLVKLGQILGVTEQTLIRISKKPISTPRARQYFIIEKLLKGLPAKRQSEAVRKIKKEIESFSSCELSKS